ncbi:MAG: endolytic transglycosylase MltG [Magnetococcales bacterium]|nr:endolytic transglycosylase MltG [Magnetococcales bacterium]
MIVRRLLIAIILVGLCVAGFAGWSFHRFYQHTLQHPVVFVIQPGWSVTRIASELTTHTIITSKEWFRFLVLWTDRVSTPPPPPLQAGEFQLSVGARPIDLLQQFRQGRVIERRLTIPEGLTAREIGQIMQKQGWKDAPETLLDPSLPAKLGLDTPSIEGWLYPDTYNYRRHETTLDLLKRLTRRMRVMLDRAVKNSSKQGNGLTPFQLLILASIIEKETGAPSERKHISSVFHNRLQRKMRLQSDPTVIYGIKNFDGDITRKHLRTYTPYNTYKINGLPPTPICNPGIASIEAALDPLVSKDLYFVAYGDGSGRHDFSKTYREHAAKVRRYQLKR